MNHTNVVDVKAWIDTRPVSRFQWNVLLLCFIIIMLDGYDAAVMGFVAPALIEDGPKWGRFLGRPCSASPLAPW